MGIADKLQKKFGGNLGESLGVRNTASAPVKVVSAPATVSPDEGRTRAREAGHLEIERIVPDPNQPRKEFDADALDRLAASLKRHGQLLPVRVRWDATLEKWVIISGERRYQAAKRAGMKTLACVFVDRALTDGEILQEQIVENLLREDLKPIEQAKAYSALMEMNHWNGAQLAEALHVSKATISRMLALLKLPEEIKTQVDKGQIPATAAYEVAKLPTVEAQHTMAKRIVAEGFTRRDAIEVIRTEVEPVVMPAPAPVEPAREFRGETRGAENAPVSEELTTPEFRRETPEQISELATQPATTTAQVAVKAVESAPPASAKAQPRKPGKPRSGTKERTFRVEGARVVVNFKRVPTAAEIVTALESAIVQARAEATGREAA